MTKKEKRMKLYRQGDVLIKQVESLPAQKATVKISGVLVEGETTGHAHRIEDLTKAEVLEIGGGLYLRVDEDGVRIVHEDHGPIVLEPGNYQVIRQVEYSPEAIRAVQD
jgi:hypothetical protein